MSVNTTDVSEIIGINLGAGIGWSLEGWSGIDAVEGVILDENTRFDIADNSMEYAFTDHFLEHVNDNVVSQLFSEVARVLKQNGVFRIVVPDFPKMFERFKSRDEAYFFEQIGFKGRPEWQAHGVECSLENVFLHWLSNYDSHDDPSDENFYRGPPKNLSAEVVWQKAQSLDVLKFSQWVVSHVPQERFKPPHGHINCFTYEKLCKLLTSAGFSVVTQVEYGLSDCVYFRENVLDNPLRKHFSLFVEATK